jgi:glyoxylase-like metal-dependent hydrolase (beta-lactamase superfamily II)
MLSCGGNDDGFTLGDRHPDACENLRMNPAQSLSEITYPFGETLPLPGETITVAPGILWLRMPLPFALNHINLWLLRDGAGWCVVDTGFGGEVTQGHWRTLFAGAMGGLPMTRIVVTHHHPDHVGTARWLQEQSDVDVWMTLGEWAMAHVVHADLGATARAGTLAFLARNGLPPERCEALSTRRSAFANGVPALPPAFRRLMAGDRIMIGEREWQVIIAHGHAPEHMSLYSATGEGGPILISGDQVLPRITTNVSVWASQPDADPLAQFIESLARFRPCDQNTLVLPSHDRVFRGLHARLDQLAHHHDERLAKLEQALTEPLSAYAALPHLFKRAMDDHQIIFAMGEAIAHLHYLVSSGKALRRTEADGTLRFKRV